MRDLNPQALNEHMILSHARLPVSHPDINDEYRRRESNPQNPAFEAGTYTISVTPAQVPLVRIELTTMNYRPSRVLSPPHIPILLQRHNYITYSRRVAARPGSLDVRGRTRSGGPRFCDDRSGAETVRSATTEVERRPHDVRVDVGSAPTGVERRLRTLKNLLLRQVRMPFRHSRISIPGET